MIFLSGHTWKAFLKFVLNIDKKVDIPNDNIDLHKNYSNLAKSVINYISS